MIRATLLLIAVAACGTDPPRWALDDAGGSGSGGCVAHDVPPTTDLTTPIVSFHTDVMPIFNHNCGTKACHGSMTAPKGSLFLGAATALGADASGVYAAIVGKPSAQLGSMSFVTPNDPVRSYLMHKLDGDQCLYQTDCVGSDCMHSMPSGLEVLIAVSTRDTIRRWIAQGAVQN